MSQPTPPTCRTPQGTALGEKTSPRLPMVPGAALLAVLLVAVLLIGGDLPPTSAGAPEAGRIPTATGVEDRSAPSGAALPRSSAGISARSGIRVLGRSTQGVRPVREALVQLIPREPGLAGLGIPAPVSTSPDGVASLGRLAPGRWRGRVFANGFLGAEKDFEAPPSYEGLLLAEFVLDALASIRGTIETKERTPVPGALVELQFPTEAKAWTRLLAPGDGLAWAAAERGSGEGGRFQRDFLPPGLPLQVQVDRPGIGRILLALDPLAPGETRELRVVLNRPTSLIGRVESGGSGEGQEAVTLSRVVDGGRGLLEEARTNPSPDGRFRFDDISPGPKLLQYTREESFSFAVGCLEATAVEEETVDAGTIVVRPSTMALLAEIVDEPRARRTVRVRGVLVQEGPSSSQIPLDLRIETGVQALLVGLPAGLLGAVVDVQLPEGDGSDPAFAVAKIRRPFDGAFGEEVIRLRPRPREGTVILRLSPPPGIGHDRFDARIALVRDGRLVRGSPAPWIGVRDLSLTAAVDDYELWALANGFIAGPLHVRIEDRQESSVSIDRWVPNPVLRGRVVTSDGEPRERAAVHLGLGDSSAREPAEPFLLEWTDADGRFVLPGVPPLSGLTLRAFTQGLSSRPLRLPQDPGALDSLELVLEPDR
jgi:hypothetical protein